MLYLAIELSLFVLAAFVLGWWMGRKSVAVAEQSTRAAVVAVDISDDQFESRDSKREVGLR